MTTTIKSLQFVDSDRAQSILSEVAGALLPSPVADPDWLTEARSKNGSQDLRQKVLAEVRQRLKIKPGDHSQEAKGRLLEYLGTLLSNYALEGVDKNRIKQRLGERGDLAPELYEVAFTSELMVSLQILSLKKSDVEEAIHRPDVYQHLLDGKFQDALSLYAKLFTSPNRANDYFLVVDASRNGYTQKIGRVWRVYPSDVDLSGISEPLDILRAFTDVYGLSLTIGNSDLRKFFLYQTIAMTTSLPSGTQTVSYKTIEKTKGFSLNVTGEGVKIIVGNEDFQISNVKNPYDHATIGTLKWTINHLDVIEVAIAYVIDMNKYLEDLGRHGIDVSKIVFDRSAGPKVDLRML